MHVGGFGGNVWLRPIVSRRSAVGSIWVRDNPNVFVRSLESLSIDAMGTNFIRVGCEDREDSIVPLLSATFPLPGRMFAALALPAAMLVTLGALATIGTPPVVIALNSKLKGDDVSIAYAFLPKEGTIAILASDARGHMGKEPIGLVGLTAGDHYNVNVAEPFAQVRHKAMGSA